MPHSTLWTATFGDHPPLGWVLREALPHRWLRIHSLPGGQRYPSSPTDTTTLLARHNAVATAVLGDEAPVVVFVARFSLSAHHPQPASLNRLSLQPADALPAFPLDPPVENGEPSFVSFAAAQVLWRHGSFDAIIKAIARDKLSDVVFLSLRTRQAYAPYDGGADLFFLNRAGRNEAKRRFHTWLSDRADGL